MSERKEKIKNRFRGSAVTSRSMQTANSALANEMKQIEGGEAFLRMFMQVVTYNPKTDKRRTPDVR